MKNPTLFGTADESPQKNAASASDSRGKPRIASIERSQVMLTSFAVDALVPLDHPVREVWAFVQKLDLGPLFERIKAREHGPGRPATDPRIILAVSLFGLHRRIVSCRELAQMCAEHSAFRWLCGDKPINQHTLSDFRSKNSEAFEQILIELLATLFHAGVLRMKRVAHDGMKIRASAGQASFRREPSLKACLKGARARLRTAKKRQLDPRKGQRKQAAQLRAAAEKTARLERALAELPTVRRANLKRRKPKEARVSTTDPEARVMRMGDGGFRPAYNVQLAADTDTRLVVGAFVSKVGTDYGQLNAMIDDIQRKTGATPAEILVDGGFVNRVEFDEAAERGVTVYAPLKKTKSNPDGASPQPNDSPATRAWRTRMKSDEAKGIYKDRAAVIETVNADTKAHRGLDSVKVRGVDRVSSVILLAVLGYNVCRLIELGWS